jgi:phosphate acetyltransferase
MKLPPFLTDMAQRAKGMTVALPDVADARIHEVSRILQAEFGIKSYLPTEKNLLDKKEIVESVIQDLKKARSKPPMASAPQLLVDPFFHCGALLKLGNVDAVVGGLSVPTAHVIRSALATVGLTEGTKIISSVFLMLLSQPTEANVQTMIFTDGAVNPSPSPTELVDIAALAAEAFKKWTKESPKVGFLSFSTRGSAAHPNVEQTKMATQMFKDRFPNVLCDGELQFDAAVSSSVARRKAPDSLCAGQINVAVFPDLNAANIGYKIAERLGGAEALGPVLLGTFLPFSDLSRGASVESAVISSLLTLTLKK